MKHVSAESYRRAFGAYLRWGTPIQLTLKQSESTTHYVWRTRGDERVRLAHAQNDGRLFAWDEPPATRHPGEEPGCRCTAEPYVPGETEFAYHEIVGELIDAPERWNWDRFLRHLLFEGGRPVTLSEIGHLNEIVTYYGYRHTTEKGVGAFRRLSDQIAAKARQERSGVFRVDFREVYDFRPVALAHGKSTVFGTFVGTVSSSQGHLEITGGVDFYFYDIFTDPTDLRQGVFGTSDPTNYPPFIARPSDLFGKPFVIEDYWSTRFHAEVSLNSGDSLYYERPGK